MALIKCPECTKEISDKAPTCPGCGCPITSAKIHEEVGVNLSTVQLTSKSLKIELILSTFFFLISVIWLFAMITNKSPFNPTPLVSMLLSFCWYYMTKIRIWWHHK